MICSPAAQFDRWLARVPFTNTFSKAMSSCTRARLTSSELRGKELIEALACVFLRNGDYCSSEFSHARVAEKHIANGDRAARERRKTQTYASVKIECRH